MLTLKYKPVFFNYLVFFFVGALISYTLVYFFSKPKQTKEFQIEKVNNDSIAENPKFDDYFIKQPKGTKTYSNSPNPFSRDIKTNITEEDKTNQKYELTLENEEVGGKLYDVLYLVDKTTQNKEKVFSLQKILYPYRDYDSDILPSPIIEADNINFYNERSYSTQKIYAYTVSPDEKYAIFTTDEEIYSYTIGTKLLTKIYDQNTPSGVYQNEAKYKLGYDYCYRSPFAFSPDYKRVYLHECLWEGSDILIVNLENKKVTDPEVAIGFGSKAIGWLDNNSILINDQHLRDIKGMYVIDSNTLEEKFLLSLEGSRLSANVIGEKIYITNSTNNSVDLYSYGLLDKKLTLINRFHTEKYSDYNEFNIWKKDNELNWDLVQEDAIYRYTVPVE